MSVTVDQREDGKFTLAVKAESLAKYTLEITANENVFLPEYRKQVTDDIVETAKNIYLGIREANDVTVRVGTCFHAKDFEERNRLQMKALRDCKRLLYLIDLAARIFHLSHKRVKFWATGVKNVKNRLYGWIEDDAERFMPDP